MPELKIKTESLPTRCEICHQADSFSPQFNHCSRCAQIGNTNAALMVVPAANLDAFGRSILLTQIELDSQTARAKKQRREDEQRQRNRPLPLNIHRAITGSAVGLFTTLLATTLVTAVTLYQGYKYNQCEVSPYLLDVGTINVFKTLLLGTGFGLIGGIIFGFFEWLSDLIRHAYPCTKSCCNGSRY